MKKAFNIKLKTSRKFIRRVLKASTSPKEKHSYMEKEALIDTKDMDDLKSQIENLKAAVNILQEDSDKKDETIAKLAREKEKVSSDLLKQRRINKSLAKQLEDERKFYFKQKEVYCHEMNEYKKLKSSLSCSNMSVDRKSVDDYKSEVVKLKQTLSQTLTSNYNLSIKFLRMKNTKTYLKNELKKIQAEHEKTVMDLKEKMKEITTDMMGALELKTDATLSPSSKQYLQTVKQNNTLVYENLCLQLEVENLNLRIDKLKLYKTKSETNSRLRYLRNEYCPKKVPKCSYDSNCHKQNKKVRLELPERNKINKKSTAKSLQQEEVIKIFEKLETPGASLTDLPMEIRASSSKESTKKTKHKHSKEKRKKSIDCGSAKTSLTTVHSGLAKSESKLGLFQVSDLQSQTSSEFSMYTTPVVTTEDVKMCASKKEKSEKPRKCKNFEEVNLIKD